MSKAVNGLLSPEEAVLRLRQLLEENPLDAAHERALFFWKARRFLQRAEDDWDAGLKGAGKTALDALKLAESFSRTIDDLKSIQLRYDERQVSDMVEAITRVAMLIAQKYGVPKGEVDEIVIEAIPEALSGDSGS